MAGIRLTTFRLGLLVSALGLGGLCLAAVTFVTAVIGDGTADRIAWSGPLAVVGLVLTAAGFVAMNVGAKRSGRTYEAVDPGRFPNDRPNDRAPAVRPSIDPDRDGPRY